MKDLLLLLSCMAFGMIACNSEERDIGRKSDVRFSKTDLSFMAQGGTDSIITEGTVGKLTGFI